jgi:hypothetical protein
MDNFTKCTQENARKKAKTRPSRSIILEKKNQSVRLGVFIYVDSASLKTSLWFLRIHQVPLGWEESWLLNVPKEK